MWLKSRVMQHYGDSVIIADRGGCQYVVYFKDDAKILLYEFYRQERKEQDDDEKARVIRSDIKDLTDQTDTFFFIWRFEQSNNAFLRAWNSFSSVHFVLPARNQKMWK